MEHIHLNNFSKEHQEILLDIARTSIENGLKNARPIEVEISGYPPELTKELATFVTLNKSGDLRGCIGSIIAHHPLVLDIAENAYSSAFKDPRFPELKQEELGQLEIHISILTTPKQMSFSSREDLINQIQPGIDGLILSEGFNRGTFLPSVWESLPDKELFLQHLILKAGLPSGYWSDKITVERYETHCFGGNFIE